MAEWGVWRWFWTILGIFIALSILFGIISWVGSWGSEAARITGPTNSREQTTAVLDDWETLQATAGNVCDVKNSKPQDGDPTIVEDPAFAYKATYRKIQADYNRRMENFFEAAVTRHLPIPSALRGLPRRAPSLREQMREVC